MKRLVILQYLAKLKRCEATVMYIYALIALIVVYCIYKERQALGCPSIPDGSDCDNANGKAVKGTDPKPNDTDAQIYAKIKEAADFADKWVVWRIAILLGVASSFGVYFFLEYRVPDEKELAIGTFAIAALVYFTMNFYKFHLMNYARNNIDKGVGILETRESQR